MSNIVTAIQGLIETFKPYCADCSTLNALAKIAANPPRWQRGRELFYRIRQKTLRAEEIKNDVLDAQYLFEEACAKTLYNLSGAPCPFDTDIPFYVAACAFVLARDLNISESEVVRKILSRDIAVESGWEDADRGRPEV